MRRYRCVIFIRKKKKRWSHFASSFRGAIEPSGIEIYSALKDPRIPNATYYDAIEISGAMRKRFNRAISRCFVKVFIFCSCLSERKSIKSSCVPHENVKPTLLSINLKGSRRSRQTRRVEGIKWRWNIGETESKLRTASFALSNVS